VGGKLTSNPLGNLYTYGIGSDNRFSVVKITPDGTASMFPGSRTDQVEIGYGYSLYAVIAVDALENVYLNDRINHRVVRVTAEGVASVVAGTGTPGFNGDGGPAATAQLNNPEGLAVDALGNLYISDRSNRRVRKVTPEGIISTYAGTGRCCYSGDGGPAASADIGDPRALATDSSGNLYISCSGPRVRKVTPRGIITTVAGKDGGGSSGDGGPATQAALRGIESLSVDLSGNLYLSQPDIYRIRKVQGSVAYIVEPGALVFSYALGAPPLRQALSISVPEREARAFSISATVGGSVQWLSVFPPSGVTDSSGRVTVPVTANSTGLRKGVYAGRLTITNPDSGEKVEVPVTMTISGSSQQLRLTQTGLTFSAVAGGSPPPPQTLGVLNTGIGTMDWAASTSTLAGGSRWLVAAPASGRSAAGGPAASIEVQVNPTGMASGSYYGLVTIAAPGVDNSPQSAVILFVVQPADQPPGPVVEPNGMIFTGAPGGAAPAPRNVRITNVTGQQLGFSSEVSFPDGMYWFWPSQTNGTIGAGQTLSVEVKPYELRAFKAGVYRGEWTLRFYPVPATYRVSMLLVVAAGAGRAAMSDGDRMADGACTVDRLLPLFRSPGQEFSVTAGWPLSLQVEVVDNCGRPMNSGQVVVNFSGVDPPVSLTSVGEGRWTGTWASRSTRQTRVEMTARASTVDPTLEGTVKISGGVKENQDRPVVATGGVLNGASFRRGAPVAVGAFVAIFGSKLAREPRVAEAVPWPVELLDTTATLGGRRLPLGYVSDGQLNGIIPFAITDNTQHQLIVRRGLSYSLPEPVLVASSEPAVFTMDSSGAGQGRIFVDTGEGLVLPDGGRPAVTGETLALFAAGLGPVSPAVREGEPGPGEPFARLMNPIRVTIQDKEAEVTFAALAPGAVGVYLVNVIVPQGLRSDTSAPVVVWIGEQSVSPPVTLVVASDESERQ
jgi:uncharacterized protein (TIGR03437 family)